MRAPIKVATVLLLCLVGVFTVSASPSEAEAVEAWSIANLAYSQTAADLAAGAVDGATLTMGEEGFTYNFNEFDLNTLDIDPATEMLMLGNRYETVSGTLTVHATGTMSAEYTLTGGPVSELAYEFDGETVVMTADGVAYTY
ncbi:MAG: hypothetical protein ACOCZ9_03400 [Spirochaetota bacterium]